MATGTTGARVLSMASILRHRASLPTRAIARVLLEADGGPIEHNALWKLARRVKRLETKGNPVHATQDSAATVEASPALADNVRTTTPATPVLRSKTHFKKVLYQMKRMQTVEVRAEPLTEARESTTRRQFLVRLTDKGLRKYTQELDTLYKNQILE
ncbi:hypothetical protein CYME_CMT440C [Cyanidioschyzon merolae strain 10D]|jgi:hypothetical protein|uniref:Uncharacterized protein n=1 Tax=Cyanidioschyzon merolae (strain NIES-3377 / 10D) TaxID=280699 RepID=M1VII0_CYAM1|nr:hypothetical protein CYME_CMT440C [Cyanidioschyzon merolae strain 10D]BAM83377.1 hypothetical protein CYME_CMT440C [Cyanidioschyzon merolae strain 10D]|eukprot:XP_005539413.1 hypothetical protein CYME_CMT440C [Cyanidioschyzon merolae strain 10D]